MILQGHVSWYFSVSSTASLPHLPPLFLNPSSQTHPDFPPFLLLLGLCPLPGIAFAFLLYFWVPTPPLWPFLLEDPPCPTWPLRKVTIPQIFQRDFGPPFPLASITFLFRNGPIFCHDFGFLISLERLEARGSVGFPLGAQDSQRMPQKRAAECLSEAVT